MSIRRPNPELVAARKREIKRRYEVLAKVGKRSRGMAAIRLSELTRWLDDTFGQGAELEPSDQAEAIARIMVHHFACLPQGDRRATEWIRTYTPWFDLRSRERLISEATHCPLKWSADKLAWKIGLRDDQRTRLKITTIGAVDCNKEQRQARQRQRRAERERARRAARKQARVPTI